MEKDDLLSKISNEDDSKQDDDNDDMIEEGLLFDITFVKPIFLFRELNFKFTFEIELEFLGVF